jgi:tape measure domain-containing protein
MSENLGDAVLVVRADTTQLEAGFRHAEERARQAGASAREAFQAPANSIAGLQAKLADLQQSFRLVEIGSAEFNKLRNQILGVEAALKTAGAAGNSLSALNAKLQGLQQALQAVDFNTPAFGNIEAEIKSIQRQLATVGASSNSIAVLSARLQDLQQSLQKVDAASPAFRKLRSEIKGVELQLATAGAASNSITGLNAKLADLQQSFRAVGIGSSDFRKLQREIQRTEQALATVGVSSNSITALNVKLQGLQKSLQGVDTASPTFRRLQSEIRGVELSLATAGAAANSITGLNAKLAGLQQSFRSVEIGTRDFRELQREIQRTERELARVDQTLAGRLARGARGFGSEALLALGAGGAAAGAGFAVGGFLKGSIDQAVELENVTRKLTVTLGPQGAAGAINFTRGISRELGLSFNTLVDTYSNFTAAATAANIPIEQQRQLFTSVSRAAQAYGLSNEQVGGTFLALQQIASKGTVSMEELRLQLAERLPVALSATAKGLGITQRDLIKLVESGRLTAGQFFPALSKGLNELTKGAAGLETSAQKFQRFGNAWQELQQSIGTNLLPSITASVVDLTLALEGLLVQQEARGLREIFGLSTDQAEQAVGALRRIREEYNLTEQQAKNIASQAVAASSKQTNIFGGPIAGVGGNRDIFGELNLTNDEFLNFIEQLNIKAAEFRKNNRDTTGETNKQSAALSTTNDQIRDRNQQTQKSLDLELQRSKLLQQQANASARLAGARQTPGLDEAGRANLEAELTIGEKLRALQISRLELAREQAKLPGTGDGKENTQSLAKLAELQSQIRTGEIDVAAARLEGSKAVAEAVRSQQERTRQQRLETQGAADRLAITRQQTVLEAAAAASQGQVSATALLQLQQRATLAEKLRALDAARGAQATELARGPEADRVVLRDITERIARANADVRQAYADAGLSLTTNARNAAEALRGAQQNVQGILRGGFEFLTPELQRQQIEQARAAIEPLVSRGVIRQGIDISTPERLFAVAGFAEQLVPAQKALENAINENAAATQALAQKDWNVYVQVPGSTSAPMPLPRT